MKKKLIAWDLGRTKCTAGLIEYEDDSQTFTCIKPSTIKLKNTNSLEELVHQIELDLDFSLSQADAICIGAAGHYDGRVLLHANPYPYSMNFADLAKTQKWPPFAVIHDYASIVCSTFTSAMQDKIKSLNKGVMNTHGRRVALGVGTGLGLKDGLLLANGDFWLGQNEAGHIGIINPPKASHSKLILHNEIMRYLAKENSITFESILTGKGLVNLYQFFYPHEGMITPEEIGEKINANQVKELTDSFAWYLGLFIGTVQLLFMPDGGIWMTGGIILNHLNILDNTNLLDGIHASPAYLSERNEYPLAALCHPDQALIGCGYYAAKRLL